jgi:WhiB family redox-sensing transcriptional regulator
MAPIRRLASAVPARLGPDLPCTDDLELFFAESPGDVETAKALCRECPARAGCLAGALERREPWGVWGGELFLRGVNRAAQAATGTPTQDRRGCLGRTRGS